ncbi:hypothetical protein CK203_095358 [Vitis vinifera]|uniref:Uncharacterized protein n=1 Tax=Vitis vinifera TaxID=29760 RepID=A0A438E6V7_VITVI|nr:hypothetical protein CK203_095358 [Vitis vinifera]
MPRLSSDSPLCIRIVLAFLDFLSSGNCVSRKVGILLEAHNSVLIFITVTPAAGVDPEAFEVIQECLREVFHIDQSSSAGGVPKGVFISLFSSMEGARHGNDTRAQPCSQQAAPAPSTENSSSGGDSSSTGLPVKELLHQFLLALTKARFFKPRPTEDANTRATKVKKYFHDAVELLYPMTISAFIVFHPAASILNDSQ